MKKFVVLLVMLPIVTLADRKEKMHCVQQSMIFLWICLLNIISRLKSGMTLDIIRSLTPRRFNGRSREICQNEWIIRNAPVLHNPSSPR